MENSFQTSFIPKKPIVGNNRPTGTNSTTSIFVVVSIFIFITMLLAAGGLYFYRSYLKTNKENLSSTLFKMKESFNKETIIELETYDKRTKAIRDVLGNHIVLSPLFELMNELTLPSIQYVKFEHSTTNKVFSVELSGVARDYRSIALQADIFNTSKGAMFKDVIFSNLTKDKNNYITFDVEFNVDPSLLSYSNNILNTKPNIEENINPVSSSEEFNNTNNGIDSTDQLLINDTNQ